MPGLQPAWLQVDSLQTQDFRLSLYNNGNSIQSLVLLVGTVLLCNMGLLRHLGKGIREWHLYKGDANRKPAVCSHACSLTASSWRHSSTPEQDPSSRLARERTCCVSHDRSSSPRTNIKADRENQLPKVVYWSLLVCHCTPVPHKHTCSNDK